MSVFFKVERIEVAPKATRKVIPVTLPTVMLTLVKQEMATGAIEKLKTKLSVCSAQVSTNDMNRICLK